MFEEQVSWPLDKDLVEPALQWVPNYASVSEHLDFAKEKFEEDIAEGMMEKMTVKQFREKFGEDTAIAALAVIVEDETAGKKRMIHDASHGVRVNHRIRCRDKIRAPGAREKKTILRELRERNEVAFSVVGDISKAHRRFKHSADDHGYLACQLEAGSDRGNSDSDIIYVNRVGTFGVSCASYWWTRIAACGIRATHHLLGPFFLLELLLYADDLEAIGRDRSGRMGIPLAFVFLAALGFPFKWAKTRGGFRVEWLGMETEYGSYRLALSAKRANWLGNWLREICDKGSVSGRNMAQGLGRLGFAALALEWEKPFLGPLYSWSSAIQGKIGEMKIPVMIRVLCLWLAERLEGCDRLQAPSKLTTELVGPRFFTDAKAADGRAWIGGFLEIVEGCQGPWFSLEVTESWAPWAFVKGDTKRVIAALELLATLIAVKLWVPDSDTRQLAVVSMKGFTDNKSNESLVRKGMTTKFPSTLILMELTEELASKNSQLELSWLRRDSNQLADDLTNEKFDSFDSEFRIPLKGEELEWKVLDKLLRHSDSFYKEVGYRAASSHFGSRKFRLSVLGKL